MKFSKFFAVSISLVLITMAPGLAPYHAVAANKIARASAPRAASLGRTIHFSSSFKGAAGSASAARGFVRSALPPSIGVDRAISPLANLNDQAAAGLEKPVADRPSSFIKKTQAALQKQRASLSRGGIGIEQLGRFFDFSDLGARPALAYAAPAGGGRVAGGHRTSMSSWSLRPQTFMTAAGDGPSGSLQSPPPPDEPAEPREPAQYRPRAAVRGMGMAALFAGFPAIITAIGSILDPIFHGHEVTPWVSTALFAVGAPLMAFGLRVASRLDRTKFPPAPGDADTSTPELAGLLLGMGSWLLFPAIFERMIGLSSGVPQNVMIAAAMILLAASAFLGLEAFRIKPIFAGGLWSALTRRLAGLRPRNVMASVAIGFGVGVAAAVLFNLLSPFFALAPIVGVVLGYFVARPRMK